VSLNDFESNPGLHLEVGNLFVNTNMSGATANDSCVGFRE
jgi:hypothetical protein